MTELVDDFRSRIAKWTKQECEGVLKVVEEQIEMTMSDAQSAAQQVETGLTSRYVQTFAEVVEERRLQVMELEEIKRMLVRKINSKD